MAKKLLLVEDDPTNATIIGDYLAAQGYELCHAPDGVEGVRAFADQHPDLVIVDILLPNKNGMEVCAEIRGTDAGRDVPIILMSAIDQRTYAEAFAEAEQWAQVYLRKPFSMADLLEAVFALVGAAE